MKEITSKKTKKVQIVSDQVWAEIQARGWGNKYTVRGIVEKKLAPPAEKEVKPKEEK